jgi:phage antirepressor YoqD-like protein
MSNIINMNALTMTSREIAELTGKAHSNVMRDVRAMMDALEQDSKLNPVCRTTTYRGSNGQDYDQYELDKDTCLTLMLGYDAVARMKVVKRWQELERQAERRDPMEMLNDPAVLRQALLGYSEKVMALETKVEEMAPKVAVHDRIADAEGSITIREAANTLRFPERKFVQWLLMNDWCYRRAGHKSLLAYADKVKAGYLYLKQTPIQDVHTGEERLSEQVRITPLGLTALARRLSREGRQTGAPAGLLVEVPTSYREARG